MSQPADQPGEGPAVWRYAMASRARVVIDAEAYFGLIRDAMLNARRRIFLIGWDFDSRIRIAGGRRWWNLPRRARFPARLGAFMVWLARRQPSLEIRLLLWNFGALRFLTRRTMLLDMLRWLFHRQIGFRLDAAHPLGCSHHQKIVVIDDTLAVCGGIDMTSGRWDTRAHLHHDARRHGPGRRYYGPWHDVTMLLEGEVADCLAELGRARWQAAGGAALPSCGPGESPWPDGFSADFENVEIGIARTRSAWGGDAAIREIEALFVEHIARAQRFIYAETQYFASRRIAEAIAVRLDEADPPEIVVINPLTADGWLEQKAMDTARVRLLHALRERDHAGRFHLLVPFTGGGEPIYVHAKLMIVDDTILRVGSANMNNRSLGLDSECDVFIDAARPANAHAAPVIARLRHSLLAEHCGLEEAQVPAMLEREGSMAAMIAACSRSGRRLEPYVLRPLTDAERAIADSEMLDPEHPGGWFEPVGRRGLFRRGGILRRPRA